MAAIRRLIILVLLAAAFVGGYYAGQRPGSPDITRAVEGACRRAGEMGRKLMADSPDGARTEAAAERSRSFTVRIDGRTLRVGDRGNRQ